VNRSAITTIWIFLIAISIVVSELLYISYKLSPTKESIKLKNDFISTTMLPDLAIYTDDSYIRHRSLADIFSIYKDDPSLLEYSKASFIYSLAGDRY
jgi:hypothetical protein